MRSIVIILFVFFTLVGWSQEIISGKVVDAESGEPLIGTHVYLLNNWRKGVIAGVNGDFQLELTEEEFKDSLIVSYVGFRESKLPISLNMVVSLVPLTTVGETVVITAEPLIAEEFKYMEIKKLEIYTNPAAKADPLLAVNALPSSTTTDESANISLRGSSPIETGTFLNNVPIYDAVRYSQLNGIGTFSIFNTSIIKDLAVFPGNPPLEFGNTTSGVISLSTDDRILDGNSNSFIVSLANIGYSREQKLKENQSLKLFTNWQPSGAIKAINSEALDAIKSFNSGDLGAYWYGKKGNLSWKILSYSVMENYEINYEHPSYSGIFEQTKKRSFLASSAILPLAKGELSFNNGLSVSNGNYHYSSINIDVVKKDFFGGVNYLLSNQKFSFKSGVSLDYREADSEGNYHEFFYAQGENHPTQKFSEKENVQILEAFVYFKYFLSEKWALGSGLRKNIPRDDQRNYLSKQLNLAFNNDDWSVILGIGNYFKHGLIENSGEGFSADSKQISMDIKYTQPDYAIAISLFDKHNSINDLTYEARGAELFGEYRFSTKINGSSSFTWLDASKQIGNFNNDIAYFIRSNLAYNPGQFWTIEATFLTREGLTFSPVVSARFDSDLSVYEPNFSDEVERFSDYSNLSLSVSKVFPISEKVNVIGFCSLNNVFDQKNERGLVYNFDYSNSSNAYYSRRTVYAGFIVNWQ